VVRVRAKIAVPDTLGRSEYSAPNQFGQHGFGHELRAADARCPRGIRVTPVDGGGLVLVERQHLVAAVLVGHPEHARDKAL
jgi:hypothetical protein